MELLDNIARVRGIPTAHFRARHLDTRTPVIIQDVFAAEPIQRLHTLEHARKALGNTEVVVSDEFSSVIFDQLRGRTAVLGGDEEIGDLCTLDEYLEFVSHYPCTRKVVTVNRTPPQVLQLCKIPEYCQSEWVSPVISKMFIGKKGDFAHLHFDTDAKDVLLYQVFGSKRVVIIPEEQAEKLIPIANYSTVLFQNMNEHDRKAFLEYTGGYEAVIRPGEAVFIPKLMWHYVDYLDTTMSISFRFVSDRNPYLQFLVDNIHRNYLWQNICARFSNERHVMENYLCEFLHIAYNHFMPSACVEERFGRIQKALKDVYERLCKPKGHMESIYFDFEGIELKRFPKPHAYCIFPGQFQTGPISEPGKIMDGPIAAQQLRAIQSWAEISPFHVQAVRSILKDLFSDRPVEGLSKQEARTLIHALRAV